MFHGFGRVTFREGLSFRASARAHLNLPATLSRTTCHVVSETLSFGVHFPLWVLAPVVLRTEQLGVSVVLSVLPHKSSEAVGLKALAGISPVVQVLHGF